MQMLLLREEGFDKSVANALTWQREWTEADWSILSVVDTVLSGHASGEEQVAVRLDRALATSGQLLDRALATPDQLLDRALAKSGQLLHATAELGHRPHAEHCDQQVYALMSM